MVNTNPATYFPRFRVGASSEVTASAVSSLIPAPTPAKVMPPSSVSLHPARKKKGNARSQMNMFMLCAVDEITIPRTRKNAPVKATYRRPIKSEIDPTKGQIAASARRLARTWCGLAKERGAHRVVDSTYKPNPTICAANVAVNVRRDRTCSSGQFHHRERAVFQPNVNVEGRPVAYRKGRRGFGSQSIEPPWLSGT